jgi:hypothetical protein
LGKRIVRMIIIPIGILWIAACLSNIVLAQSQNKYTISGQIKDASSGEALIGASIYVEKLKAGCSSNTYGFYSLTLPEGGHDIVIRMMGYSSVKTHIDFVGDIKKDFELKVEPITTKNIVVTAESVHENVKIPEMGSFKLQPSQMKTIPVIMGEQDLLKTIQLMPGIQAAAEGNTGFFVRGGGADQNLILLDEATVYNASHLMGFFSVFNSDAIKDVVLTKGAGSAEYGGRLSSVLDIKMKEGNLRNFDGSAGVGLVAAHMQVEGPLKNDKSSFFLAGRRTYFDFFLRGSKNKSVRKSELYFYDLNAKTNYQLGAKDRLYLSGYFGKDVLGYKDEFGIDWGNTTATIRWNHLYNHKLFSNTTLIFSLYKYNVGLTNGNDLVNIYSSIKSYSFKEDFQYFADSRNTIKFGVQSSYYTFVPGEIKASNQSEINELLLKKKYALENAFYLNHEWKLSEFFSVNYGLRYSGFSVLGPGEDYIFDNDGNPLVANSYKSGKLIKYYGGIEPRITLNYILTESSSLKASYSRNRQYLHLISTSTTTTPFDLWHPSTKIVKPGIADQYAIGYFRDFADGKYEMSTELYYKDLRNQVDLKNGANIFFNKYVESQLVFGKGRSYGLELYVKKKYGRLTGWLSYTLSKTQNKFPAINGGDWYNARQDRTHDIALVGIYDLSRAWTFSATWVYMTGNAVTFPYGKYGVDGHIINLYSDRNGYRMPNYHRLDIGFTWKGRQSSWNFSLYNAYGRKNAYAISFRKDEDDPTKTQAVRVALFSFFPSITYNLEF